MDKENISGYMNVVSFNDIVFADAQSIINNESLIELVKARMARVIFIYNLELDNVLKVKNNPFFLSKKIRKDNLLAIVNYIIHLKFLRTASDYIFQFLTLREQFVMRMSSHNKSINDISRVLGIPKRSVYAEKRKVLKKIGLSHLNTTSILVYKQVFLSEY
ncbi:hypothetical protein IV503_19485 [Klebsiella huaxiensis]|uniref:LuxR C-terminal-related transcriptional regulator n=1 Tax=Klebsiella huaxiensis TaxID=2153354 RepID=UPI002F338430